MGNQRLGVLQGLVDDGDLELGLGFGSLNNGSGRHSFCCFFWGFVCEAVRIGDSTGVGINFLIRLLLVGDCGYKIRVFS